VPVRDLELRGLLLDLHEQADVLDRDRGLASERLDELDLACLERAYFDPDEDDHAQHFIGPQQRDAQAGVGADGGYRQRIRDRRVGGDVSDVDRSALPVHPSQQGSGRRDIAALDNGQAGRQVRSFAPDVAGRAVGIELADPAVLRLAQ